MAKAKKKASGLSVAIVALNIVTVGIAILLVILVYMHMREEVGNGRDGSLSPTATESGEASSSTPAEQAPADTSDMNASASDTSEASSDTSAAEPTTTPSVNVNPLNYNKEFFENDMFIGDSISTGLYLYGFLDQDNVFAETGLNPESALTYEKDGLTCAGKAQLLQPRNIYIMLGTNGLAFLDGQYMCNKLVELIAQLETACPTAEIYVISIPPVTAVHEAEGNETMSKVLDYNYALKSMCQQGGFTYIDLCSVLQDETGYMSANYAEADGLHFLSAAYIRMLNYVEQCAQ